MFLGLQDSGVLVAEIQTSREKMIHLGTSVRKK